MLYRLNKYLLHYNIFISICAVALVLYFSIVTHTKVNFFIYPMTFFGTMSIYNFFRLYPNLQEYTTHKSLTSFKIIILSLIISGLCYLFLPKDLKLLYMLPLVLSLFYKFPLLNHKDLRSLPFAKVFIIAGVWILAGAIPVMKEMTAGNNYDHSIWLRMLAQFFFFIAITIPFDVFDMEKDTIKTFATAIGKNKAILTAKFFLLMHLICAIYASENYREILAHFFVALITFIILSLHRYLTSRKWQYYCVDGLIILQTLVILLLH